MYRTWEFDIKNSLKVGTNQIEIRFGSALKYIEKNLRQLGPMPSWDGQMRIPGSSLIRKMPCNFGWDWGPKLVTCGIWRNISIIGINTGRIREVEIRQQHQRNKVTLNINTKSERLSRAKMRARVTVSLKRKVVAENTTPLKAGKTTHTIKITDPQLWWPAGMGKQPLYDIHVELLDSNDNVIDKQDKRIGLRTLRLNQKKDKWGRSFEFVANNRPFFAKGANWIPAHTFINSVSDDFYRQLLNDTVTANMNMIRVWGGGIYEQEIFYNLCDELGICVWQDFMFACSTFPTFDENFMANVKIEAEENVRRLRHHPCMALWCGNNELEQGLVGPEWNEHQMSWQDYKPLFDKLLKKTVKKLNPECDYWPSSPHSPTGDRANFNNPECGDAHLWNVWHGREPFEWYQQARHRFVSEFGFQSFPEPQTVKTYTAPQDRNVTSYVMEHHQRSRIGNSMIITGTADWFLLPSNFEMTLWLSQITHAYAMQYAIEHFRRQMPQTMGTLYWQLNDCWPVASWASIDSLGKWKALHYLAGRFFSPVLVSAVENRTDSTIDIHLTSDLYESFPAKLTWTVTDCSGKEILTGQKNIKLTKPASQKVHTLDLKDLVKKYSERDLIVWMEVNRGSKVLSRNLATLDKFKHLNLEKPKITADIRTDSKQSYTITLKTNKPALWTWLEFPGLDVRLSDNFIHLKPQQPVTIELPSANPITLKQLKSKIRIRTLLDT